MKLGLLIFIGLTLTTSRAQSQGLNSAVLATINNPVTSEMGGGLIISSTATSVFVLTANHVVDKADSVMVTLNFGGQRKVVTAMVFRRNEDLDLSLLKANAPGMKFEYGTYMSDVRPGDVVNIRSPRLDYAILPLDGNGQVMSIDDGTVICKMKGVEGGDSGSPVWADGSFAGVLLTTAVAFVPAVIVNSALKNWGINWQWKQLATRKQESIVADKPPEIELNAHIKVRAIRVVAGNCVRPEAAMDKQLSTFWQSSEKGWNGVSFDFGVSQAVSRVRMYFPDADAESLPVGYFQVAEHRKVFFSRSLSHFEPAVGGSWLVYNLPEVVMIDKLEIFVKVKQDGNNKPTPIAIYEVQIFGAEAK
ncbi:trypsin-like peptidase domain-containing protein [Chryseolinea sp. T2]|uniref:trypsin-like peptidase domain-containing protein n=1 Tax=Chryseolinea sp. T2 TaxID=3129255 RepID=UPI003076DFA1